jgi:hypothetical protein
VAAAVVIPPLVNIGRYQRQVTALMSNALGRPVHLSSVELRLLPRPGFVLHDLTVSEDPKFGAEPILFARSVVASVGIFPLWRGKLQVTRVNVDEASLNLVRTSQGRWNLESLMQQAQPSLTGNPQPAGPGGSVMGRPFPYLEATNSRVNLMRGAEKGPFSLVNTDLSLWQDQPGEWRVRLRGQPVRTDMEMIWADTGEVRLEGSLRSAPQLRDMPLKLQAEWREAQLGQLSRLLLGSDAGWRGDLTADVEVEGTADAAQTKARLRATGVRREEFTPETPLDLDANCTLRYQRSQSAIHDVDCDTSIGKGKLHLKGDLPGSGEPTAMLEVKQVPLQAALDLLRTVRSGLAPGMSAKGEANGTLEYVAVPEPPATPAARPGKRIRPTAPAAPMLPLKGSLILEGGVLRGGQLKEPLVLPVITFAPVLESLPAPSPKTSSDTGKARVLAASAPSLLRLESHFTIPLGTAAPSKPILPSPSGETKPAAPEESNDTEPKSSGAKDTAAKDTAEIPEIEGHSAPSVAVHVSLGVHGYQASISGSAPATKARDLAYAFGLPHLDAVDAVNGGTSEFDLSAAGPWTASKEPFAATNAGSDATAAESSTTRTVSVDPTLAAQTDVFSGYIQLHRVPWKAPYLARAVDLSQATVTFAADAVRVNSDFSYGTPKDILKGSLAVKFLPNCKTGECNPPVQLHFGALDAALVQAALLGPAEEKSILTPIVDRIRAADQPKWPAIKMQISADSLVLGPAQIQKPTALARIEGSGLELESWEASGLGGTAHGTGKCNWSDGKPSYSFEGQFSHLNPASVATVLGTHWKDGSLDGTGNVTLSGLNEKELAASASGEVQFQWNNGSFLASSAQPIHFDAWTGQATLASGKAEIKKNTLTTGKKSSVVAGVIPFGGPAKLTVNTMATTASAQSAPRSDLPTSTPLR